VPLPTGAAGSDKLTQVCGAHSTTPAIRLHGTAEHGTGRHGTAGHALAHKARQRANDMPSTLHVVTVCVCVSCGSYWLVDSGGGLSLHAE